jgi:hypothetical protein
MDPGMFVSALRSVDRHLAEILGKVQRLSFGHKPARGRAAAATAYSSDAATTTAQVNAL